MTSLTVFFILLVACFDGVYSSLSNEEISYCVNAHNKLRLLHDNTEELEWDDSLAQKAQQYADKLIDDNKKTISLIQVHEVPAYGLGENLAWRDQFGKATCEWATLEWYNEIKDYSYGTASSKNGKKVKHFTQVVWRETRKFGVGIATMDSRNNSAYGNTETFIVAKYSPRGNFHITGQRFEDYSKNVQPRKPGSVTPTIEELTPCVDNAGEQQCQNWMKSFQCEGIYKSIFERRCAKYCEFC